MRKTSDSKNKKSRVIIGFFGPRQDVPANDGEPKFQPSLELCKRLTPRADRFELLHQRKHKSDAESLAGQISEVSPNTTVRLWEVRIRDPWRLEQVFYALHTFAQGYKFDLANEEYLAHISTGSHIMKICLFLLTEVRYIPARLVQTPMPGHGQEAAV
jgi:transcriptional regulatory protein RtcR